MRALAKGGSSSTPAARLISFMRYVEALFNIALWGECVPSEANIASPAAGVTDPFSIVRIAYI